MVDFNQIMSIITLNLSGLKTLIFESDYHIGVQNKTTKKNKKQKQLYAVHKKCTLNIIPQTG